MADVPDFTAAAPKHLIRLGVPGDRVMQSFQPVGGQWFVSKVGSGNNGDDTRIYRLDATGELLDWCTLAGGGHGSTMGYTTDDTDVWLWFWWRTDTTGGTYTNRCVKWKYRGSAEGITVTRDDADVVELADLWGDTYVTYSIDQANDLIAVDIRDSATATRTTELRTLSEYEAGTGNALHTVGPINVDYDAAYQGHTFDSDRLYIARGNVALGRPLTLHSYDWTSGAEQILTVTSDVYTTGDWLEIEGVAMHPTDGLLFGIATGPLDGRIADVYQVVEAQQPVTPPSRVNTFSTDSDPSLFLEQDVDGAPVRLGKDSAVLVRSATDGTPLPATKTINELGYLAFTTDGIPGVQVSGDDGATWKGPFWSRESRASTITGDLSGSRLLDEDTGQLRAPLVPPSVMPSDSTVAPIVSNTTTSTYAAVQTAAHAALDSTIATKVDASDVPLNGARLGMVADGITDNATILTDALASLDGPGGKLEIPPGNYSYSETLNIATGVTLAGQRQGSSGMITGGGNRGTRLIYTGTGNAISCDDAHGWTIEDLDISYTSTSQADAVLSMRGPSCSFGSVRNVSVHSSVPSTNQSAPELVDLTGSLNISFDTCRFQGGKYLIRGVTVGDTYAFANCVRFENCFFRSYVNAACVNPDKAWVFASCSFEPNTAGVGVAATCESGHSALGVAFRDCWAGDNTADGAWIAWRGDGLTIDGGAWTLGSGVGLVTLLEESNGISVSGAALRFGSGYVVDIRTFTGSEGFSILASPGAAQLFRGNVWPKSAIAGLGAGTYVTGTFDHVGNRLGFYGNSTTTQPTVPAAGTVTADDLRAALVSLGLIS